MTNSYPRGPTREELEYTRAMALLKQRFSDPLGDDLSDHVARLVAQVEAARAECLSIRQYSEDDGRRIAAEYILEAMDEAKSK